MLSEFGADTSFTQNRELSWLRFNERVLEEADDSKVPLFERLKFLSIFTSNLDEFFMIRVGSLGDMALLDEEHVDNKSGMSAQEQLKAIDRAVRPLAKARDKVYSTLEKRLREYNVCNLTAKEFGGKDREWLDEYFESLVLPVLSPQIMDTHHPFPHLENKALYVAVMLESKQGKRYGLIPVPGFLPRVIFLPGSGLRYVLMEELLLDKAERIFERYEAKEKTILSVTRSADIALDEESYELEENFLQKMKKALKNRERMAPVRLESTRELNKEFL
ncbi:MAG TPA: RNA degradosome polyphosphate kinase, partial [Clostridia bacterium]|nr:RNA degradosome polyphosphate kinase [Clostridia bacterium]